MLLKQEGNKLLQDHFLKALVKLIVGLKLLLLLILLVLLILGKILLKLN